MGAKIRHSDIFFLFCYGSKVASAYSAAKVLKAGIIMSTLDGSLNVSNIIIISLVSEILTYQLHSNIFVYITLSACLGNFVNVLTYLKCYEHNIHLYIAFVTMKPI